ncbi:diacylglycerol O-acyltransferase 1 isoform X3 [Apis florea]|uniref:diacylglycerol O-acyltransferase 1 isoform X3 n=1 Tax=Apis florea TaxID=7463 RepID=UPI0012FE7FDA|nr:diacylglycerol O-acyltransferase 1 isoform X3 [Apis florea]
MEHENDTRVRLRRTKSETRAEEIQKAEQMVRKSQPDKPCHRPRDSLFSWSSGFDNFTGFVNWGFLLLGIGGIRLLLENFIKYGIRVDPWQWFLFLSGTYEGGEEHPSILLIIYSTVPIGLCLLIEKGLSLDIIAHGPGMMFHIVNLIVMVLMPMVVIHVKDSGFSLSQNPASMVLEREREREREPFMIQRARESPLRKCEVVPSLNWINFEDEHDGHVGAMYVCMLYAVLFLKLWSYVQVNMWCRVNNRRKATSQGRMRRQSLSYNNLQSSTAKQNGEEVDDSKHEVDVAGTVLVQYPDNLTFRDLYYFILAPTLCYELNFPRTQRIRKRFLIKRILEVVVGCQVVMSLFQQWMIPCVKNSLVPFSNMDVAKASERLLKLAIPNHLVWLCFFYLTFHSLLNLVGELLHFADRNFYCDWWNAHNIDIFWRTWNMPVHRWAVR